MMDTATAVMLPTYNGWADDVLFGAMGRLPREHLYRPTKTLFGSMIGTLNHNYQVMSSGEPTFSARSTASPTGERSCIPNSRIWWRRRRR
jgi:hypothetical protein